MAPLASYYYYSSSIFLLVGICDFIFIQGIIDCPFGNNQSSFFLVMGIINIFIVLLMWLEGFCINYYLERPPEELVITSLYQRILYSGSKVFPMVIKAFHLIKAILCFICIYFAFFANNLKGDPFTSSNATNVDCLDPIKVIKQKAKYKTQIQIFEIIELISIFIVFIIYGIIKKYIPIEGYFYIPSKRGGGQKCKHILLHELGP